LSPTSVTFAQWWRECESDLRAYVARRPLPSSEVEEVLQDAALYVWARRGELNEANDLRRLAFFKLRYLLLDRYRASRKEQSVKQAGAEAAKLSAEDPLGALIDYRDAFERLPPRQRAVVEYVLSGREYAWIAHELGIAEATVRSLWRHAQVKLAEST
jgi:RNA polymerase sigma factor (sigma-70 family)